MLHNPLILYKNKQYMSQPNNSEQALKPTSDTPVVPMATPSQFNFFNPQHLATMQRACNIFANSELVPEMYRISEKNPEKKAIANCMIALETANRIGASPLMVMQNMYIVHGQPAWSAKFLTATVNGCGRYNSIKYRFRSLGSLKGLEYTEYVWDNNSRRKMPQKRKFDQDIENFECVAYTTEKGSDEVLESIPVTIDMAIKEGWYTKDGSKWQTMPKLMLQYRSVTFWTRAYAPELSMGIKAEDEVRDIEDIEFEDVTSRAQAEIAKGANKQPVSFDQAQGGPGNPPPADQPPAGGEKDEAAAGAGAGSAQPASQPSKAPF